MISLQCYILLLILKMIMVIQNSHTNHQLFKRLVYKF
jgi:hypothetical protein